MVSTPQAKSASLNLFQAVDPRAAEPMESFVQAQGKTPTFSTSVKSARSHGLSLQTLHWEQESGCIFQAGWVPHLHYLAAKPKHDKSIYLLGLTKDKIISQVSHLPPCWFRTKPSAIWQSQAVIQVSNRQNHPSLFAETVNGARAGLDLPMQLQFRAWYPSEQLLHHFQQCWQQHVQ